MARASSYSPPSLPRLDVETTQDSLTIHIRGQWRFKNLDDLGIQSQIQLQTRLQEDTPKHYSIKIIIDQKCHFDSAGACLIARLMKGFQKSHRSLEVVMASPSSLVDYFLKFEPAVKPFQPRLDWKTRWLDHIGFSTVVFGKTALSLVQFLGEVLIIWFGNLKSIRWVSVFHHCEAIGIRALPIIGLISLLIGMVLAYQSINQLQRFGAELYVIDFLGISILREIAVLLTAIVIAGRSGSAFTAQIGTMVLNQEVDAIRMLGLNPILVLVVPRLLAILFCLPLLVFFSMILGLLGGMITTTLIIDVAPAQFSEHFQRAVSLTTFWVGMSKAPLFALLIGLVGCFRGFQVKGSAESVGRMTTQSVVESIFLVIVFDAFMSILFSYLKV